MIEREPVRPFLRPAGGRARRCRSGSCFRSVFLAFWRCRPWRRSCRPGLIIPAAARPGAINAAAEPYGFATAAMRLSTYRKIEPGPTEEMIFYDHPSGYDRVHRAMTWLSENRDHPRVLASLAMAGGVR